MNYWAITFRASLGSIRNLFKFIYMTANDYYVYEFMTLCKQIRFLVIWILVAENVMTANKPRKNDSLQIEFFALRNVEGRFSARWFILEDTQSN